MNFLKDIIQRCHQRNKKPLRQRKTIATRWVYKKNYPHQFTVYCAHKYPVILADLEQAGLSFMPIGHVTEHDWNPAISSNSENRKNWNSPLWEASWGIQAHTGTPSERNGARWHDLNFKYEAICAAPDIVLACIEALVNTVANPLLTISESGGLRFSCRVPDYLHANTEEARLYVYKETSTQENLYQRDVYLEILGEEGSSFWDARYEILLGNLLDPPIIDREVLFAYIDTFRALLHEPAFLREKSLKPTHQTIMDAPPSLGSDNLNLARAAFVKRGFSYIRQDEGFHHWTKPSSTARNEHVSLWEHEGTVWIWAFTPDTGLPMEATPITDVWNDTGIQPSTSRSPLPVSDKVLAVREGKLSPLAIKRPKPMLQKLEGTQKVYQPPEKSMAQIRSAFEQTSRITGLFAETGAGKRQAIESYVRNGGAVSLSGPHPKVEETELYFQKSGLPFFVYRKTRMHLWHQIKEIPVEARMANPFQHGNLCEDPERCVALEKKGGDPQQSICPKCPVYTECQQRGYLSQIATLQRTKTQIFRRSGLFFDPQYSEVVEEALKEVDNTERLCIINESQVHNLFIKCRIKENVLQEWSVNWEGSPLGNFAKALLNAIETEDNAESNIIKRTRAVFCLFQYQEEKIVEQMCQVNVPGRVVERGVTDDKTGRELARFTIQFEGGAFAYIPLDNAAADRLAAKELPFYRLGFFVPNEDIRIPMQMAEAIGLGILDVGTVENIQTFPTTCQNPNWTLWHQLKRFFGHYTRDSDAPMKRDDGTIWFWVPPVLHPDVKRLLVISSSLSDKYLHQMFPNEEIKIVKVDATAWLAGNRVFQTRSGNYPLPAILDYDNNRNPIRLSKKGRRIFLGIQAEVERDPSVKHAIVTYKGFEQWLTGLKKKDNVCFLTDFKKTIGLEEGFEEAQVLWIVSIPRWAAGFLWLQTQTLFGNDEKPISYEGELESHRYEDERVQDIYKQYAVRILAELVGQAGLNRLTGKTIVLVSNLVLPNITDRPETLLFDWEDFEVAGGLDKLAETIATRQHFEDERAKLTAESSREEVERVLGCSSRQANRVLQKLRGGAPLRVPLRDQIFSALAAGRNKTSDLVDAVEGYPTAVKNELKRLVDANEIVKVRWGTYALKTEEIEQDKQT